jgi:hypothetical protein
MAEARNLRQHAGLPYGLPDVRCCRDQDHPLTGTVIFVLPEPATISVPTEVMTTSEPKTQATAITHLFAPPSLPPRSHTAIA